MNCKLKRKDLVLIKWNSKYMTDREGCSLSEDVKYLNRDNRNKYSRLLHRRR